MASSLLPIRAFLVAIFMIMAGSGFLTTLVSVRLEGQGLSAFAIGLVGTAYFAGLAVGSARVERLIAKVGHIRAFAAFVTTFSASTLSYGLVEQPLFWAALRFVDGCMVSGVFVCIESWLNDRAEAKSRSSMLAGYMIALYLGQAAGQFLLNVDPANAAVPFMLSAVILSLAALPVVLTKVPQPDMGEQRSLSLKQLYAVSPLGIVGVMITGLMLGSFYSLAAVYLRRLGMELSFIAMFTSAVIAGGVLLQWPLGRLSDRLDRRRVTIGTFGGAVIVSALLAGPMIHPALLVLGGMAFGGIAFALYPLCVAHTNDHLASDERVGASGGLVMAYSIGAVAGPPVASAIMTIVGPSGLFGFIAASSFAGFAFGLWRMKVGEAIPSEDQEAYQILPRTTPVATTFSSDT